MEKRLEVGFTELKGQITRVETDLKGEIKQGETELRGEIKQIDTELKRVEGLLTAEIKNIDKRLANEELVSRGFFITVGAAIVASVTRFVFFS